MAPIIPNPKKIRSFRTAAALEAWLRANHDRETEIWLKIHKKDAGLLTVTHAEALDVALCWGWIDGIRKSFDDRSFLQRSPVRGFAMRRTRLWGNSDSEIAGQDWPGQD
jgi:uncharacterized protein YdeI (YjbR/CyaY-like superfamily)